MKKQQKYIIVFIAVIAIAAIVLSTQSFQVLISDMGQCKLAEQTYYTIDCSPAGDPQPISYDISGGNSFTFNVLTVSTRVDMTTLSAPSGRIGQFWIQSSTGTPLCYEALNSAGTFANSPPALGLSSCNNLQLTTGQTYTVVTRSNKQLFGGSDDVGKFTFTRWGTTLRLRYTDDTGRVNIPLDASDNCKLDDVTTSVQKLAGVDPDASQSRSLVMQQGQAVYNQRGYREVAQIAPINVNGYGAICDINTKTVYGYTKVNGLSGVNYCLPDKSQLLVDGRTKAYFVCAETQCQTLYGLSTDYKMNNFFCEKVAATNQQCQTTSDCSSKFVDQMDASGNVKTVLREATGCSNNVCVYTDKQVGCNPSRQYPNTLICKRDQFGNYVLESATTTVTQPGQPAIPPIGKESSDNNGIDMNIILGAILVAVIIIFIAIAASKRKG